MVKRYLILFGFLLFSFTPLQTVKAETVSKAEDWYVTPEDIIGDIVFPTINQKVPDPQCIKALPYRGSGT